jgi:hypothetical protein
LACFAAFFAGFSEARDFTCGFPEDPVILLLPVAEFFAVEKHLSIYIYYKY